MKRKIKLSIQSITKNQFFQGGVLLTVSSFAVNILNCLFNFLAGRSLGPSGYGEITTLFSYIYIFSVPLGVFSTIIIQKISAAGKNRVGLTFILEDFFLNKIKCWWFLILLLLILIPFLPKLTNLSPFTAYSLVPLLMLSLFFSFYGAALQGLRLFFLFSLLSILTTVIKLLGPILSTIGLNGLNTIIFFLFLSNFFILLASRIIIQRTFQQLTRINEPKNSFRLKGFIDRQFLITGASLFVLTIFTNVDIIFVRKFFTTTNAGIYSSWSLFSKIILYALSPLITVSFIFFAGQKNAPRHRLTLIIILIIIGLIGIGNFLVYVLFGQEIIYFLFGNKFKAVIPYLSQASIFGSFYTAITFINSYFLAKKNSASLILFFFMPFYLVSLFLIEKQLINIIRLNIFFSILVTIVYLIASLFQFKPRSHLNI